MPIKLDVDWEHARHLYYQGVSTRDIALELGIGSPAVKARCSREQWTQKRDALRALEAKQVNGLVIRDLKELASDLKQRLAVDAERTLNALESQDPTRMTLEKLEQRERIASALQKRTWTTLGLDVVETQSVVNVAVMNALAESLLNPVQVTDVQVVTEEAKSGKLEETPQN